jgi:hypothetical protein
MLMEVENLETNHSGNYSQILKIQNPIKMCAKWYPSVHLNLQLAYPKFYIQRWETF